MHRITKIELAGVDKGTNSVVKLVHNTAKKEPFYTKTCAYNQTFEKYERTMVEYGGERFNAIPLKIETLRYLTKVNPRSVFIDIKNLTRSRLENDGVLFHGEVERIKKKSLTDTKVIIYYFQIPQDDWQHYDFEDIKTLVMLLVEAGVPHITIPFHPKETFVENSTFFEKMKKELRVDQSIICQFSPNMKKREGEQVLQKAFIEDRCIMTLFAGLSPNTPQHLYYYSYCWTHHPRGKLLCAADVQDTFGTTQQKLATHHALRRFGFDITCRRVTFPISGAFDFPTPPEKNFIYDSTTGGMFRESDQEKWHGVSVTDFILENFPANTGLSFREYVLSYNFEHINKVGLKEADSILRRKHIEYIREKPILHAYWESK